MCYGSMQYGLKNHWPRHLFMHTNSISIIVNLSNDYASLVSALCACIQVKKMASQMKPYLLSECFQVPL